MIIHSTVNNKGTIHSDYLGEDIYNLLDKTFQIPLEGFSFNVYVVEAEHIARPDLVSLDAYGDTMFADIICKINGISNPFELNEGMKLILPNPDYILDFAIKPPKEESENSDSYNKPIAKQKQSKRKANEAVVGDSRYKIDPATGVIIY